MSFSQIVKNKLCATKPTCQMCIANELLGVVCFLGNIKKGGLIISSENLDIINRICFLFKQCFGIDIEPENKKNKYNLGLKEQNDLENMADEFMLLPDADKMFALHTGLAEFDCCKQALLRGCFLGGGYISDPKKQYHLEFVTKNVETAKMVISMLEEIEIKAKVVIRKNNYIVYIKESEKIADTLAYMGASSASIEVYNTQVEKEMRNSVNRTVNCETANLDKSISASVEHIKAIAYIVDEIGLDSLDENLKEIATLRLENSNLTLKELGQMLDKPLTKSGVNHRLNKIIKIANDIKNKECFKFE